MKDQPKPATEFRGSPEQFHGDTYDPRKDKPTTGGHWERPENWHPKPANGEQVRPMIFDPEHYPEDRITELEQQLAAEREKVQTLRDALVKAQHRFNKSGWPEAAKEIEDALARH